MEILIAIWLMRRAYHGVWPFEFLRLKDGTSAKDHFVSTVPARAEKPNLTLIKGSKQ